MTFVSFSGKDTLRGSKFALVQECLEQRLEASLRQDSSDLEATRELMGDTGILDQKQ